MPREVLPETRPARSVLPRDVLAGMVGDGGDEHCLVFDLPGQRIVLPALEAIRTLLCPNRTLASELLEAEYLPRVIASHEVKEKTLHLGFTAEVAPAALDQAVARRVGRLLHDDSLRRAWEAVERGRFHAASTALPGRRVPLDCPVARVGPPMGGARDARGRGGHLVGPGNPLGGRRQRPSLQAGGLYPPRVKPHPEDGPARRHGCQRGRRWRAGERLREATGRFGCPERAASEHRAVRPRPARLAPSPSGGHHRVRLGGRPVDRGPQAGRAHAHPPARGAEGFARPPATTAAGPGSVFNEAAADQAGPPAPAATAKPAGKGDAETR